MIKAACDRDGRKPAGVIQIAMQAYEDRQAFREGRTHRAKGWPPALDSEENQP